MKTFGVHTAEQRISRAQRLLTLECSGRYRDGLNELADIWPDHDAYPDLKEFEPAVAAEMLLRCGSLIGFHGHTTQDESAQLKSRNLLMTAQSLFLVRNDLEKATECDNHLALTCWRLHETNEAQISIDEAVGKGLPTGHPVRLFTQIVQCLVNMRAKKFEANLAGLRQLEAEFLASGDECLIGDYFNHCGIALDNLGRKSEALDNFEFARYHHLRSGHRISLGTIENNLAWLYKASGRFDKAHASIDNATRLFKSVKDKTREGYSLDTKATLFLDEQRYIEALKAVEKGLSILKPGGNKEYLMETLLTKAKVLIYLENFPGAVVSLIDAVNIARIQSGEESAGHLIAEFEKTLRSKQTVVNAAEDHVQKESFELAMPASLANYEDYRGVWITNDRLETAGLEKGSLAIVAISPVNRGDLAAVTELETDEVICGFYDADFGMVCLEAGNDDPLVFDETQVRILGKIIGVCRKDNIEKGKMAVEPIRL